MDALYCCQCPAAFVNLLCSMAATWTKNNSKNAQAIAMPSAYSIANIVVWLCSIDPVARLLCSMAACNMANIMMPACNMADMRIWLHLIARSKARDTEIQVLTAGLATDSESDACCPKAVV